MSDLQRAPVDAKVAESTRINKAAFLVAMDAKLTVTGAAKVAGVHRSTVYLWLNDDPEFKAAFEAAREGAVDALEESAYERALKGDTVLTIFLLKNNRERYREVQATQHAIGVVKIEFDDKPPIEHVALDTAPRARIGEPVIDGTWTIEEDATPTPMVTP